MGSDRLLARVSPEGQVRRSTSARLGEVRDSSRRMRPARHQSLRGDLPRGAVERHTDAPPSCGATGVQVRFRPAEPGADRLLGLLVEQGLERPGVPDGIGVAVVVEVDEDIFAAASHSWIRSAHQRQVGVGVGACVQVM